ncbi:MAG: hypothetical protein OHK0052_08730 [Anaerolineales bacterium]
MKSRSAEKWVINASPVIALAHVGQLALLTRLPQQAVIPRAVQDEILRAPEDDPARRAINSGLLTVIDTPTAPATLLAWDLGQGETAVLSYAFTHREWIAILDDGAALRCARSLSVRITGTLAVVILAKQYGLIPSAVQILHDLRSVGFRLDDAVIRNALARTIGETWLP